MFYYNLTFEGYVKTIFYNYAITYTIIAYFDLIDSLNHIDKIIIGATNLAD